MHQRFQVIGSLAVPGKMGEGDNPDWYFNDLSNRPDERDMKNVALFVDDIMKKLKEFPYYHHGQFQNTRDEPLMSTLMGSTAVYQGCVCICRSIDQDGPGRCSVNTDNLQW